MKPTKTFKLKNRARGNAMVEFVFVMPILGLIFMIMFQLYLIIESKHKVIESARYGAWELAARPGEGQTIRHEIKNLIMDDPVNTQVTFSLSHSAERSTPRSGNMGLVSNLLNIGGYNYYFDPLFSLALFSRFAGFNLGLARALDINPSTKVHSKVTYRHELEYIDIINELGSVVGGEDMTLADITLTSASVLIYDDWAAKNRREFARRVGVPSSKSDIFNLNFALRGLWLYPQGTLIGPLFSGLNIVYTVAAPLLRIIASVGRVIGIEVEFEEPIDPRGRYFRTDNAPDIPEQQQVQRPWWQRWWN